MSLVLSGMPDFHDTVEFLRHKRQLSRESTANKAGFSISRLNEVIQNRTQPGPKLKKGLFAFFDLTPTQQRHLQDLLRPSAELPPLTGLRQYLTDQGVHHHLDYLDQCEVMGAYLDPLQNVLHGNKVFYRIMPGLDDADHNIGRWMCSPTARDLVEDWHEHLLHHIRRLRASLGRYRDAPRAQALFQTLRNNPEFRAAWDSTPLQVSYNSHRSTPLRLHHPDNEHPIHLNLEIDQYGACFEILSVHGLYNTHAIAS
ncbi:MULTISPECIES: MmyB family transcriptional regulator [Nocardia]|uniref:Xre family DNA-binding protein n=1 Tax=Nocardia asteroides NBRC 15531 TaxID=1110697 RepID=U5EAF0_NOCAS|nr:MULTISPECIES: XRE family transcriptional regulator [Nocardia]TLF63374.1 hypothetical protein FEK33_25400 [Nocardia asteroides NBRC 15531]UGT47197.1 hypothetical protein LT345_22115 [Nocardia asteroides]SFM76665.1 hypothetical protein SAMN05444423_104151 [Nocardia asteroides]VEG33919.1 Uncharacterised protein [Nocardia asteroides]GAD87077.1 putative Xre family DNA-binding protein [Nocardia asteroides NBRC 15531]